MLFKIGFVRRLLVDMLRRLGLYNFAKRLYFQVVSGNIFVSKEYVLLTNKERKIFCQIKSEIKRKRK